MNYEWPSEAAQSHHGGKAECRMMNAELGPKPPERQGKAIVEREESGAWGVSAFRPQATNVIGHGAATLGKVTSAAMPARSLLS
jgi:hypothetical protein